MLKGKKAFTLIEVIVSVLIISIVIMALLQMFANNTHIFLSLNNKTKISQYSSFFISSRDIGFEDDMSDMYKLVEDFTLEDDLRRELKNMKMGIMYQEVKRIDMSEFEDDEDENTTNALNKESNSNIIFEIGKTILTTQNTSVSFLRLRLE